MGVILQSANLLLRMLSEQQGSQLSNIRKTKQTRVQAQFRPSE